MPGTRRLRDERAVPLNVPIPYPLRDRLDDLKKALDDADLPAVPVREIVATLLLFAEEDGVKLRDLVERYRNASPGQAAIGGASGSGTVIPFKKRSQGRPRSNRPTTGGDLD
jgi:hypothetical protein